MAALLAFAVPQEPPAILQIDGARAGVRVDGQAWPGASSRREHAAGPVTLHFGAGRTGKPASLEGRVPDGGTLAVGVRSGPPAEPLPLLPWQGPAGRERDMRWAVDGDVVRCAVGEGTEPLLAAHEGGDGRITARIVAGAGAVGLCARWQGGDCYLARYDGGEVVLLRRLSGHELELGRVPVSGQAGTEREVALQCAGFRLEVWLDDAPVIRVMDGAHTGGRFGLWADRRGGGTFRECALRQVAAPGPVLAVRRDGGPDGEVAVMGVVPSAPGGAYALGFWLDRGFPLVLGEVGAEVFVLGRNAAPCFLVGGTRGLRGFFGDLDREGRLQAGWRLPGAPVLRGHAVQVGGFVLNADGSAVVGLLPRVGVGL